MITLAVALIVIALPLSWLIGAVIGGGTAANIDHVIRPLVYRRVSNIHPMITLVGAFAGVQYFGLLGGCSAHSQLPICSSFSVFTERNTGRRTRHQRRPLQQRRRRLLRNRALVRDDEISSRVSLRPDRTRRARFLLRQSAMPIRAECSDDLLDRQPVRV